MSRPVYIIDGSRTPFLKAQGGPGPFTPVDLAVQAGRPLLARQPFKSSEFDQVIIGCVSPIADEVNPARVAALRLGMGENMVAFGVQINCGSGMQSIDTAYRYIQAGQADMIALARRFLANPRWAWMAAVHFGQFLKYPPRYRVCHPRMGAKLNFTDTLEKKQQLLHMFQAEQTMTTKAWG